MRPFEDDEADLFFGQEKQVAELVRRLGRSRLLGIVGESGCGKSSLVKAGLIPTLLGGHAPETSLWRISVSQPGTAPIRQLAESLAASVSRSLSADQVERRLRSSSYGLFDLIRHSDLPPGRRVLIVIDQFEELFRFWRESEESTANRDEAALFVKLLLAVTERPNEASAVPVYVALTMRSEYLGDCALFFGLAEAINDGAYLLPKMNRLNVEAAIVRPLNAFDATIDNDLLQELLNETEIAQQDGLPLLQHGLRQLWTRASSRPAPVRLTMADLRSIDEATPGALFLEKHFNAHLDGRLKQLSNTQQQTIKALFKQLGEYDAKGRLIRRTCTLAKAREVCRVSESDLLRAASTFRDEAGGQSFLMPPLDRTEELKQGHESLGVCHEALLRHWATLVAWIEEEARDAEAFKALAGRAVAVEKPDPLRRAELTRATTLIRRVSDSWSRRYRGAYDNHLGHYQFDYARTLAYLDRSRRLSFLRRIGAVAIIIGGVVLSGTITYSEISRRDESREAALNEKANQDRLAQERLNSAALKSQKDALELKTAELERTKNELETNVSQLNQAKAELSEQVSRTQAALQERMEAQAAAEADRVRAEASALDADTQRQMALDANRQLTEAQERESRASERRDRDQRLRLVAAQDPSFDPAKAPAELEALASLARSYAVDYKELPAEVLLALQRAFEVTFLKKSDTASNHPVLITLVDSQKSDAFTVIRRGMSPTSLGVKVNRENWSVQKAAVVPGDPELAVAGAGGFTAVANIDGQQSVTRKLHPFAVTGLGFSTDGEWMATASAAGDMRLIRHDDLHKMSVFKDRFFQFGNATKLVSFLVAHRFKGDYAVREFALSMTRRPDQDTVGRRDLNVVALTEAGRVVLWRRPGPFGKQLSGLDHVSLPGTFNAIATNPATQEVWIAGNSPLGGSAVGLFDMNSRFDPCENLADGISVSALGWNESGTRLAIGFRDGTVRVVTKTSAPKCAGVAQYITLPAHATQVTTVSWHGDVLATGSSDGSARLWTMPQESDRLVLTRLIDLQKSQTPGGSVQLTDNDIEALFRAIDRRMSAGHASAPGR